MTCDCGGQFEIKGKTKNTDNAVTYKLVCDKCGRTKDMVVPGRPR